MEETKEIVNSQESMPGNSTVYAIYNTAKDWGENKNKLIESAKKNKELSVCTYFGEQYAPSQNRGDNDDLFALQNFFILVDYLDSEKICEKFKLFILYNNDDDWGRLSAYLYARNDNEKIIIKGAKVDDVNVHMKNGAFYGRKLKPKDLFSSSIGSLIPLLKISADDKASDSISFDFLKKDKNLLGELEVLASNPKKIHLNQNEILLYVVEKYLEKIYKQLKRIDENCKDKFFGYIKENLKEMPLLTQVLLIYWLYYEIDQNELLNETNKEIRFDLLEKIRWDAISYGEGILQLLENCCLHSSLKCGYLSIIINDVALKTNGNMIEPSRKRERIFRKYRFGTNEQFLNIETNYYMEIQVSDGAFTNDLSPYGILHTNREKFNNLTSLFKKEYDFENDDEKIIHHYGMPLFHSTVLLNEGRFICSTPAKNEENSIGIDIYKAKLDLKPNYSELNHQETIETGEFILMTQYQILLPLTYNKKAILNKYNFDETNFFDTDLLKQETKPSDYKVLDLGKFEDNTDEIKGFLNLSEKKDKVNEIFECLKEKIYSENGENIVYKIKVNKNIEIVSKAIYKCISVMHMEKGKDKGLFILEFANDIDLCSFIRMCSIFYDFKAENKWMKNVQFALFSPNNYGEIEMKLVLAGTNLESAFITAKTFGYYNLDNSLSILSQVKYLTRICSQENGKETKSKIRAIPLFPFDLLFNREKNEVPFLEKMKMVLNKNMCEDGLGCKISNIHIRLGSKIHLDNFYAANMLFNNIGTVYRFTYLLAEDIISEWRSRKDAGKELVLIGYEQYSSILMMQLKSLLSVSLEVNVSLYQYIKKEKEQFINLSEEEEHSSNAFYVFVLPIGTTLSTIYKIKNTFKRKNHDKVIEDNNILGCYSLIVVDDNGKEELYKKYWKKTSNQQEIFKQLKLTPEYSHERDDKRKNDEGLDVKYLLMPCAKWHSPYEDCFIEEEFKNPLGQVDKTSTLPSLIYPLIGSKIKGISSFVKKNNTRFIEQLKGCISYGHIVQGNNHYQYYIDNKKYYQNCKKNCKDEWNEWFQRERDDFDLDAFNIVVSPIIYEEPLFLKDVIDKIFNHSLHFLYIPIQNVYREDIRARFSYFTQEYKKIIQQGSDIKINVYYVDYTIVSGNTLRRGQSLINMLLAEEGIDLKENVNIFKKVILLLNRSSYDTIASIVKDTESQFSALSTLVIPSINTLKDSCPICERVKLYDNISKCSATNELYWHYQSLLMKHKRKDYDEYEEWLNKNVFNDNRYLKLLCRYLILNQEYRDKLLNDNESKIKPIRKDSIEESELSRINSLCIKDILKENSSFDIEDFKKVMDDKAYKRMLCTHNIMMVQEKIANEGWYYDKTGESEKVINDNNLMIKICEEIFELWNKDKMFDISSVKSKEENRILYKNRELLISYLKVSSREYISQLAPFRKAIYNIMEDMLNIILGNEDKIFFEKYGDISKEYWENIKKLLYVTKDSYREIIVQQYELYLTLAKRLSDLQSNYLFKFENCKKIYDFTRNLRGLYKENSNEFENISGWYTIPSEKQASFDYIKMLKWAAMSSPEESKGFLMKELYNSLNDDSSSNNQKEFKKIAKTILLENTRVIYSGIKRLDEISEDNYLKDEDNNSKNENNNLKGSDWKSSLDLVENSYKNSLNYEITDGKKSYELLPQNMLSEFFTFIDSGTHLELEKDFLDQIGYMLLLYKQIKKMEKDDMSQELDYLNEYNKLCMLIQKIVDASECYLVHKSNSTYQIIAQSKNLDQYDNSDEIDEGKLNLLIKKCLKNISNKDLEETLFYDSDNNILLILLRIKRRQNEEYSQKVFIVLKLKEKDEIDVFPEKIAYKVLFLRQQLQLLLERDLYALHHFRYSYEDVKSVSIENKIRILHLTDIHISRKNHISLKKLIDQNFLSYANKIDLLVITGDIVQGNTTAVDLEENYKYAGQIITEIAKQLWTISENKVKMLRSDWKKRIIIIPGNHDYASMNELSAVNKLRSTNSGVPSSSDGSAMVKFSYYIEFIQKFFNINIDELLRNNLNEFREYPELNLNVLALNTVAEVSTLRNNKMQLDKKFADEVNENYYIDNSRFNLLLGHHTKIYQNDYLFDQYYERNVDKSMMDLFRLILKKYSDFVDLKLSDDKKIETKEKEIEKIIYDQRNNINYNYERIKKDASDSQLFLDIDYIFNHWKEITNERCMKILAEYKKCENMSNIDHKEYEERLKKIEKVFYSDIMLGGHRHERKYDKEKDCYEGAKFEDINDKGKLNFGILEIEFVNEKEKDNYTYTYKQETLGISNLHSDVIKQTEQKDIDVFNKSLKKEIENI